MAAVENTRFESRTAAAYAVAPFLFVVFWSTGFVGARYGLPFAGPLTLLSLRFSLTLSVLLLAIALSGARWPRPSQAGHLAVTGILAHGVYLGTNFYAMRSGMPLAFVALIGGLQPLLTALAAGPFLGEEVSRRVWAGLGLGLAGVFLVIWPKLGSADVSPLAIGSVVLGLFGMTGATLYQKRFCPRAPLLTGAAIQFGATFAVVLPLALAFDVLPVSWPPQLLFAIAWLAIVLSIGAMTLLWLLIRRGEASQVASMFYLVPPVTAVFAYVLFGERLSPVSILGMTVAAAGVALVTVRRVAVPPQ